MILYFTSIYHSFLSIGSSFSFKIFVAQSHILADSCFDLLIHLYLHFALGVSSVAAKDENHAEDYGEAQAEDSAKAVSLLSHEEKIRVVDIVGAQVLAAHSWWILEASADGVENGFDLELTTEGLVIYDDTWESGWLVLGLVSSSLIYKGVVELGGGNCVVVCSILEVGETLTNTPLSICEVKAIVLMSKS